MKYVGFMGGSSLVELGSSLDMIDFFVFFNKKMERRGDITLSEQLYRKYIRLEQLELLDVIVKEMKMTLSSSEDKYLKYLSGIEICIASAEMLYESWEIYQPLKIGVTDVPYYIEDKNRPLEQYDALTPDDLPFWLR